MDPHCHGPLNSSNGIQLESQRRAEVSDQGLGDEPVPEITPSHEEFVHGHSFQEPRVPRGAHLHRKGGVSASSAAEDSYPDDFDFSDGVLRYIDQMLMEDDTEEDNTHMLQGSSDFRAEEKSFYELLGEKYPFSPDYNYSSDVTCHDPTTTTISHGSGSGSGYLIDVVDLSRLNTRTDRLSGPPMSPLQVEVDMYSESHVVWSFRKGVEDASKFLPSGSTMLLGVNGASLDRNIKKSHSEARGVKNHRDDGNGCEEERSNKLPAVYVESNVPIEEFDEVLLRPVGEREKKLKAYRKYLLRNAGKKSRPEADDTRGKNHDKEELTIDLTSLLINCAHSIAADDFVVAREMLKQIRQQSSPSGNGSQRLGHYFADGIEARLAGTGSLVHKTLTYSGTISSDYLKGYYTFHATTPFCKTTNYVANKTIMMKSEKAMRVHIIDFGIFYGFQWPSFLERLGERKGGPPTKLRITGIDFPQPGFRPTERIEDTGRRLAYYAKMFNVLFEYNAIGQKWETIRIEDLKIEEGEFVAVNCLYRAKNLRDDTGVEESPRTMVLNLIRKINPDIFVHGILNGAYGVPFFMTRFREALFHFSALFDMLETNIPRENPERMIIEKNVFGKEAMNVIACEGRERLERPETYKQWQLNLLRAGFKQVPFEREVMDSAKYKVRNLYHRNFLVDEHNHWLLMGWKGRIVHALSCWQPV
ncbi:hypothetical protein OROMI_029326 [Orobanche minor]